MPISRLLWVCLLLSASFAWCADKPRLNVLLIAVDDLRPEAGCYGNPVIRTPAIDRLARQGTVFLRAYCQQAVCSPSRTSLLLGRRPDTTRIYDLQTHFRKYLPDVVTLPQHFKQHGYHTQGLSKIYHNGLDDPASWSVPHWSPKR
jgi:arylsulfatase A-like enzyme